MYPIVTSTFTVHGILLLLQGWGKVCLQDGILGTFLARNRVAYPYKVPRTQLLHSGLALHVLITKETLEAWTRAPNRNSHTRSVRYPWTIL